jgi:hypothetical protein
MGIKDVGEKYLMKGTDTKRLVVVAFRKWSNANCVKVLHYVVREKLQINISRIINTNLKLG